MSRIPQKLRFLPILEVSSNSHQLPRHRTSRNMKRRSVYRLVTGPIRKPFGCDLIQRIEILRHSTRRHGDIPVFGPTALVPAALVKFVVVFFAPFRCQFPVMLKDRIERAVFRQVNQLVWIFLMIEEKLFPVAMVNRIGEFVIAQRSPL